MLTFLNCISCWRQTFVRPLPSVPTLVPWPPSMNMLNPLVCIRLCLRTWQDLFYLNNYYSTTTTTTTTTATTKVLLQSPSISMLKLLVCIWLCLTKITTTTITTTTTTTITTTTTSLHEHVKCTHLYSTLPAHTTSFILPQWLQLQQQQQLLLLLKMRCVHLCQIAGNTVWSDTAV